MLSPAVLSAGCWLLAGGGTERPWLAAGRQKSKDPLFAARRERVL